MMLDRKHLLLAHDMGLGKTVSSIAACERLVDSGEAESILVIAPASVKWQWKHEIDKFTDGGLVKVIEGNKNERTAQYRAVNRGDYEYIIVNYEQIVFDWDIVRHLSFDVVVCDEVVAIKSPGAKRTRHVRRLRTPYRFGLSGQPIENKPEELYSIMQWVDKDVLGSPEIFDKLFVVRDKNTGRVKLYKNLPMLRERMGDSMHRKTRQEVADQMPDVVEQSYIIDFDPATKRAYKYVARELIELIRQAQTYGTFNLFDHYAGVGDNSAQGQIMARLMALRMLCDHPALLDYSADQFEDPDVKAGSVYIAELRNSGVLTKLKGSPKLNTTLEVMGEILDANPRNKIVLFSFFKPMLSIISDNLKVGHEIFTGDYTVRERDASVQRFTKLKSCRVLLSSDAGGIGLNLPAANYLFSYDLPWSAGKFAQRNARIVRLSSKWPEVTLSTMIMRHSIEERMEEMLAEKLKIASAWVDGKGIDKHGKLTLTLDSLADFLQDSLIDL